jgi:hypothetical protein
MKTKSLITIFIVIIIAFCLSGCGIIRKAPTDVQKQNAWIHYRTSQLAADTARTEHVSENLKQLTNLGQLQSSAFVNYFGLPKSPKQIQTAEQAVSEQNFKLAEQANLQASEKIDGWGIFNNALEIGIGLCAVAGGVWGTKFAGFLKTARVKSKALKEIIEANEIFKSANKKYSSEFKKAHNSQSKSTKKIVTEMKN